MKNVVENHSYTILFVVVSILAEIVIVANL
jgi:hypothetical protein